MQRASLILLVALVAATVTAERSTAQGSKPQTSLESPIKTQIEASDAVRRRIDRFFMEAVKSQNDGCNQFEVHVSELTHLGTDRGINASADREFGQPVAFSRDFMESLKKYAEFRLREFKNICPPPGETHTAQRQESGEPSEKSDSETFSPPGGLRVRLSGLQDGMTSIDAQSSGDGVRASSQEAPPISSYKSRFGIAGEQGLIFDGVILKIDRIFASAVKSGTEKKTGAMQEQMAILDGGVEKILHEAEKDAQRQGLDFKFPDQHKLMLRGYAAEKASILKQLAGLNQRDIDNIKNLPIDPLSDNHKQKSSTAATKAPAAKSTNQKAASGSTTKRPANPVRQAAQPKPSPLESQIGQQILQGVIQGGIQYGLGQIGGGGGHRQPVHQPAARTSGGGQKQQGATNVQQAAPVTSGGAGKSYLFQGFTGPGR
jgi:hypothetical protein